MEAIVKTSVSIYPSAKGVTLAVQPQGAAEIKVEFSPLEAMKQAHTLILHAMSHTRGPSGSTALPAVVAVGRIALKAVEMAETALLDPARFVAREETAINLGEALDTLRGELDKMHLRICEARGDQLPDDH